VKKTQQELDREQLYSSVVASLRKKWKSKF